MVTQLEKLQKKIGSHPLLGAMVYWSFSDVDIPAQELQDAFEEHGIEYRLPNVTGRRALTKALTILKKAQKEKMIEKILEDEDQVVYAVLDKEVDRDRMELEVENLNAVIFNKATQDLEFKFSGDAVSEQVKELFQELQGTYNAEDMRRLVKRYVTKLGCIMLRERGGVYFVPVTQLKEVERLSKMVDATFRDSHVSFLGIVDTERTQQTVGRDFKREMLADVETAAQELVNLLDTNEEVRASTLQVRLDRYRFMHDKIEVYSELLRTDAKKIDTRVRKMEKVVAELMI